MPKQADGLLSFSKALANASFVVAKRWKPEFMQQAQSHIKYLQYPYPYGTKTCTILYCMDNIHDYTYRTRAVQGCGTEDFVRVVLPLTFKPLDFPRSSLVNLHINPSSPCASALLQSALQNWLLSLLATLNSFFLENTYCHCSVQYTACGNRALVLNSSSAVRPTRYSYPQP